MAVELELEGTIEAEGLVRRLIGYIPESLGKKEIKTLASLLIETKYCKNPDLE